MGRTTTLKTALLKRPKHCGKIVSYFCLGLIPKDKKNKYTSRLHQNGVDDYECFSIVSLVKLTQFLKILNILPHPHWMTTCMNRPFMKAKLETDLK